MSLLSLADERRRRTPSSPHFPPFSPPAQFTRLADWIQALGFPGYLLVASMIGQSLPSSASSFGLVAHLPLPPRHPSPPCSTPLTALFVLQPSPQSPPSSASPPVLPSPALPTASLAGSQSPSLGRCAGRRSPSCSTATCSGSSSRRSWARVGRVGREGSGRRSRWSW